MHLVICYRKCIHVEDSVRPYRRLDSRYPVSDMKERNPGDVIRWLFSSHRGAPGRLVPRWIFLRALALIYFSAFYSLLFQIKGLIGPQGILPAHQYLAAIGRALGPARLWYAPSLFWISSSTHMLMAVTVLGLVASMIAFFNLWPRLSFLICFVCFLSFVASSSTFSSYQSDGMLLEAGFIVLFFAPRGIRPGWGAHHPPSRASLFLLQWEWFRIYFESGMVKLISGDEQWRHLTAMDEYYQNGPLPTWVGWYVEHFPHWFHVASAAGTLVLEFVIVLMLFFPRRVRLICFLIVTPWEFGVILTANYTFLNYLVLSLGFLLLDDKSLLRFIPSRFHPRPAEPQAEERSKSPQAESEANNEIPAGPINESDDSIRPQNGPITVPFAVIRLGIAALMLSWIFYDTTAEMLALALRRNVLPTAPITALEPFRIANQYGLFAVMTRGRYEIEFQGSNDGSSWTPYLFQCKPQLLNEAPRIYAPYQPRFDWNLWFASLSDWQQNDIVPLTEEHLLVNDPDVLGLFKGNPFAKSPPRFVRAVLWQYWFTSKDEKHRTSNWWRRQFLGVYAPEFTLTPDGRPDVVQWPDEIPEHD